MRVAVDVGLDDRETDGLKSVASSASNNVDMSVPGSAFRLLLAMFEANTASLGLKGPDSNPNFLLWPK
jgi:hypothetical protein